VTFTPNATGNQTVTATYNGDDSVHQSTTGSSTLNVKRASKTTVTCSVSSAPSNSDVSCSVSVTDALGGAGTPTGTVTLTTSGNGAKASPTTCTVPTGSPSCSSITFSLSNTPRVNTLTATFTPTDAVYDSSTGSANVTGT
jgi:hypothetical protein